MPRAQANGLTIEYETFGRSADPALILIMGLGTQLISWPESFCRRMAEYGLFVVRFDNRDSGLSSKMDGQAAPGPVSGMLRTLTKRPSKAPYTLDDMALDTLGLMDALGIKAAHIAGVSMGGMIAQQLAVLHPSRVLTLTSWMSTTGSTRLPWPKWKITKHMFLNRPSSLEAQDLKDYYHTTLALIASPGYAQDYSAMVSEAVARNICPEGFQRQLAAIIASGGRRHMMPKIKAPTLVIHGRDDPLIPLAGGKDTAARIEGARLEIIDGMGHDLPEALMPRIAALIWDHISTSQKRTQ